MPRKLKKKQKNVLVVCHGNICRSPVASLYLQKSYSIRQGGFVNPGRRSPKKIRDEVYGLAEHRSRLITVDDLEWADTVVYMDNGNRRRLVELGADENKLYCLANAIGETRIADPNYMKKESPELKGTLEKINECCKRILADGFLTGCSD